MSSFFMHGFFKESKMLKNFEKIALRKNNKTKNLNINSSNSQSLGEKALRASLIGSAAAVSGTTLDQFLSKALNLNHGNYSKHLLKNTIRGALTGAILGTGLGRLHNGKSNSRITQ